MIVVTAMVRRIFQPRAQIQANNARTIVAAKARAASAAITPIMTIILRVIGLVAFGTLFRIFLSINLPLSVTVFFCLIAKKVVLQTHRLHIYIIPYFYKKSKSTNLTFVLFTFYYLYLLFSFIFF